MKPHWTLLVLVSLLAGPAAAQDQADLDAFGVDPGTAPLDELVPDDGGAAPVPQLSDTEAEAPASAMPEPAEPGPATVAAFDAPSDWPEKAFLGLTLRYRPDWQVMDDSRDGFMIFNGDMQAQQGGMFGLTKDRPENIIPPEPVIRLESKVQIGGLAFVRRELTAKLDPTHTADMIMLVSEQPIDGPDHLIVVGMVVGKPLDDYRPAIEQMLGTLRYEQPLPQVEAKTALDGLFTYAVPERWNDISNTGGFVLYPGVYSASITVLKGEQVDGRGGILEKVPSDAVTGYTTVLGGQDAYSSYWQGTEAEYVQGSRMVPGEYRLFRLARCAPDGQVLALVLAGIPETLDSAEFKAALDGIALAEGAVLTDCAAPAAASAAPDPLPAPEMAAGGGGTPGTAPGAALPVQVQVGGVTYHLPQGWTAGYDTPDDKMWTSPDGRFTVLSFWWFPDEPLTGYDDQISVENVMIDHEPVTRIISSGTGLSSIKNVTERPRADGKRFIFPLEANGSSPQGVAGAARPACRHAALWRGL